MLGVHRAQFEPVLWRVLGFSIAGVGAIMLLITAAAARENGARKIAELPRASQLPATTVAKPIPASIEFCRRFPAECRIDLREPATIKLTTEIWSTIRAVNSHVNASIIPITDYEQWGVADRLRLPATAIVKIQGF